MFLSRAPLIPKNAFDLHALGTPPAFVLSQDQTRRQVTAVTACTSCLGSRSTVAPFVGRSTTNGLTVTKKKTMMHGMCCGRSTHQLERCDFGDKKSADARWPSERSKSSTCVMLSKHRAVGQQPEDSTTAAHSCQIACPWAKVSVVGVLSGEPDVALTARGFYRRSAALSNATKHGTAKTAKEHEAHE